MNLYARYAVAAKPLSLTAMTLFLIVVAGSTHAVTIDFAKIATEVKGDLGDEAHWNSGELVGLTGSVDGGQFVNDPTLGWVYEKQGIRVKATASGSASDTDAYLDGFWINHGPGGIGACATGPDCTDNDNVAALASEQVTLAFYDAADNETPVQLIASYHTQGDHGLDFTGDSTKELELFVGGSSEGEFDLDSADIFALSEGDARMLSLNYIGSSFTFDALASEFYVSGIMVEGIQAPPVPIPAAAWLFVSALGLFGFLGKRRARA